ncbi:hypothetical protein SAMN04244579_03352 [Azotobacter beijerinckii]|uniref:AAA domain-containing protein n=1 Tax=Azotobacter beijerinckii TaxID=170623 RepID=A0A1H6WW64_9GAMM|nr:hypothetical protein [Azotobacter beijerinckii]SEJ16585.1 hypothetical protein SAMN04244579_03352 [Azotobacter beijerinckii]
MSHTLFSIKVAEPLPDSFKDHQVGLPDNSLIDSHECPSVDLLHTFLGMNRSMRRSLEKRGGAKTALNFYCDPRRRLYDLFQRLPNLLSPGKQSVGGPLWLWELSAFTHYRPDWRSDGKSINEAYHALPEEDRTAMARMAEERLAQAIEYYAAKPAKRQDKSENERERLKPQAIKLFTGLAAEVLEDLKAWDVQDVSRKIQIANAAFGCYTVFGKPLMDVYLTLCPDLRAYYAVSILNLPRPTAPEAAAPTKDASPLRADAAPIETLVGFYEQIHALSETAQRNPHTLDHAERLAAMLQLYLPQLREAYSLSEESVRTVLHECIALLVEIGQGIPIDYFSDDGFLEAFRGAWLQHAADTLQAPVPENYLEAIVTERAEAARDCHALVVASLAGLDEARGEVTRLEEQLDTADFRDRKRLIEEVQAAESHKMRAHKDCKLAEDQGLTLLLPPAFTIENLPADDKVPLDVSRMDASVNAMIAHWQAWSGRESVLDRIQAPNTADSPNAHCAPITASIEASETTEVSEPEALAMAPAKKSPVVTPTEPAVTTEPEQSNPHAQALPAFTLSLARSTDQPELGLDRAEVLPAITEPGAPIMEPTPDPLASVDLAHYHPSVQEVNKSLVLYQEQTGYIPAVIAENISLLWVRQGHLGIAWRTLRLAQEIPAEGPLLAPGLMKAAFYGLQVWRGDTAAVRHILGYLDPISQASLDVWLEKRPGYRVVPYLVFAATFQATLFAGNMTHAPRLLNAVASHLDEALARLVADLIELAAHNKRLDLDTLQQHPKTDDKAVREALANRVAEWRDRVNNKQTGWAPARQAMKDCLNKPVFATAIAAIEKNDAGAIHAVRAFADALRDEENQVTLMTEAIGSVMRDSTNVPQIEGNARKKFLSTVTDLVGMADEWLEEYAQQNLRTGEMEKFARRFMTMSTAALTTLNTRLSQTQDLELKAGLGLARQVLDNICQVANGNEAPIWEWRRTIGWLAWPEEWVRAEGKSLEPQAELTYWLDKLGSGMNYARMMQTALDTHNYRHGLLLALYRRDVLGEDVSEAIAEIDRQFLEASRQSLQRSKKLMVMLDNANVASLLSDDRHYQLMAEVDDLQEQIRKLHALDDPSALTQHLETIEIRTLKDFKARIDDLRKQFEALVTRAGVDRGPDFVSSAWIEQVNAALANHDTTVAEEMLGHLEQVLNDGGELPDTVGSKCEMLVRFLEAEPALHHLLKTHPNPREIFRLLGTETIERLNFTNPSLVARRGLERLLAFNGRIKGLDKGAFDAVSQIVQGLGLEPVTTTFSQQAVARMHFETHGRFAKLSFKVKRRDTTRGVVFFNQGEDEQQINVLIATGNDWTIANLHKALNEDFHTLQNRTLLLSYRSLDIGERNELAEICKREEHTLFLADPVMMAMLAGLDVRDHARFKTFLHLALPWTYCNPYTGSQMQPAPPEMRYGRQKDLRDLKAMRGGAAMIFGGRQLGKSTLLHETARTFNNPQAQQHAYITPMDGDLDRANLTGDELDKHRSNLWNRIYGAAVGAVLLPNTVPDLTIDEKIQALEYYFKQPNAESLIVCLDEIDRILALDAANGFPIFRRLSALVNTSNSHFKVIIAGLENVSRFADAPNYPLHQLGASIQVSIMTPSEALQLIKEPLGYLGYDFESPVLVSRILVETNRHPGLIHIFCHHLIKHLASRHAGRLGTIRITTEDIEHICKDDRVRELIRDRFDITLSLDGRYKLIAYSLVAQGTNSFTPSRAKEVVKEWAPEIFGPMSVGQFEAFLGELVGLGVLNCVRRVDNSREYALRNANILNLLGGKERIADKLLEAVEAFQDHDPMAGHAFPDKAKRPSPLTLRDEKVLIARPEGTYLNDGRVEADSSHYSVGIIAGSEALGLNAQWMSESLAAIGKEEKPLDSNDARPYQTERCLDSELGTIADFQTILVDTILEKRALLNPILLLVEVTGDRPLSHTLDLIDTAHTQSLSFDKDKSRTRQRVRVVFLLSPKALWLWRSQPELTRGREALQPFILLDLWNNTALVHLLNHMKLENTSTAVRQLEEYSRGWYFSLNHLLEAKQKKDDAEKVSDFGPLYTPLLEGKPRQLQAFLHKAGADSQPWSQPLLQELVRAGDFDAEDLAIYLLEMGIEHDPSAVLGWLGDLRLVVIKRMSNGVNCVYHVEPSVAKTLALISADDGKS